MTCSKLKLLLGATSLSFLLSTSCSFAADVAVEPIDVEGGESPSKVAGRKGGAAPASQIDDSLKQAAEKRAQALLALAEADKEEKKAEAQKAALLRQQKEQAARAKIEKDATEAKATAQQLADALQAQKEQAAKEAKKDRQDEAKRLAALKKQQELDSRTQAEKRTAEAKAAAQQLADLKAQKEQAEKNAREEKKAAAAAAAAKMAKKEEQEEKIHAFYRTAAAEREEKITTQSQDLYKNTLSLLQDLLLQSKLVEAAKGNAAHLNRQAAQFKALLEALGGEASKKDIAAKNAEATKQFKALQGKQLGAALNGAKE